MIGRSVVRRYVRAAFDMASETGTLPETQRQLEVLQAAARVGPELCRLLRHPTLTMERKLTAIEGLLGEPASGAVRQLAALVVDNGRAEVLSLAGELFQELADERAGVLRARVTTPLPLGERRAESLRAALSRWRSAPVRLELHHDPSLIGGMVVRIGDRVLDGSIRGRLTRVAQLLGEP